MTISRSVVLGMRNVSEQNCRENRNTRFMFDKKIPPPPPELDVRGSVHHSIIHTENPKRCTSVSDLMFMGPCIVIIF